MLSTALILIAATSLAGIVLAAMHGRAGGFSRRAGLIATAHGGVGLSAFLLLVAGLEASHRRSGASGVSGFGTFAAVLLAGALILAGFILAARLRRKRLPAPVIGMHAMLAVSALVVLAAYLSAP